LEPCVTTFKCSDNETDRDRFLNIIETIDLHHGEYSSESPWSVFEVVGLSLTEEVSSVLKELGFMTFTPTTGGFLAMR
jgi:hypothetical protein